MSLLPRRNTTEEVVSAMIYLHKRGKISKQTLMQFLASLKAKSWNNQAKKN